MKSQATVKFWKLYARLPGQLQQRARQAYQLWRANPGHPSLRFKRVDDEEPIYSARINEDYRVLGLLEGDTVIWFWIGNHDEYERLLK
jgi:plasmid maintenance system killer protein